MSEVLAVYRNNNYKMPIKEYNYLIILTVFYKLMQRSMIKISLREQIEDKKRIIVLPGVFDALSARIAEQVGFEAMFQTGTMDFSMLVKL
ncbi:MAG: phosphonomutase-like enzyme [Nitrososphaeraceae archaeon]|nr:phosphonomutase-like enzyme [Nitrososphaeraceae archaeon]